MKRSIQSKLSFGLFGSEIFLHTFYLTITCNETLLISEMLPIINIKVAHKLSLTKITLALVLEAVGSNPRYSNLWPLLIACFSMYPRDETTNFDLLPLYKNESTSCQLTSLASRLFYGSLLTKSYQTIKHSKIMR